MYSETFKKLKLYESIYPGEIEYVTKKELDELMLQINQRNEKIPFSKDTAALQSEPLR